MGGKLRSGAVEPNPADSNFRFAFWPWQFPEKMGFLTASLGLIAAENCRFSPFGETTGATGVRSESPYESSAFEGRVAYDSSRHEDGSLLRPIATSLSLPR